MRLGNRPGIQNLPSLQVLFHGLRVVKPSGAQTVARFFISYFYFLSTFVATTRYFTGFRILYDKEVLETRRSKSLKPKKDGALLESQLRNNRSTEAIDLTQSTLYPDSFRSLTSSLDVNETVESDRLRLQSQQEKRLFADATKRSFPDGLR